MRARVFSVAQIVRYCKEMLEEDVLLGGFFMEGEISNCKRHSSGHVYFTMKDASAAINAVMFRGHAQALAFVPENGMKVIAYGRVSMYEKTGQVQLYAELLEPMGKGGLYTAFEQLKAKFQAEGLFDPARKRAIPADAACVAVITSPTGAAVRDVITVIRRRNRHVSVVVVPALVQGESAAADIARAIREVNQWGGADVLIVGRGGGSIEDLWAFNEEVVARAIVGSKLPVVSAVGHETDFTIADFVADLRAATPSAAAELVTQDMRAQEARAAAATGRLGKALTGRVAKGRMSLAQSRARLEASLSVGLNRKRMQFDYIVDGLQKVSPLQVLRRGYAYVADADGKVVSSVGQLTDGMNVTLTFADGAVAARVCGVSKGMDTFFQDVIAGLACNP